MDKDSWGRALIAERTRRGWTQAELARAVGVSRQQVFLWENGSEPLLSTADRIIKDLGLYLRMGHAASRKRFPVSEGRDSGAAA